MQQQTTVDTATPEEEIEMISTSMQDEDTINDKKSVAKQYTVGRVLGGRLRRIFQILLSPQASEKRVGLLGLGLLVGKLCGELVFYYAGKLPSEFYKVLGDRNQGAFIPLLLKCLLVVCAAGAAKAALEYVAGYLGVVIREVLTIYTHERYIRSRRFYPIVVGGTIDNPDQRIAQDIERLGASLTKVLPELLVAPFLIAYYTVRCWSMAGVFGPLAVYIYFIGGALATRLVMPPVIRYVYAQERAEGDLRFHELRIAEFAESIAFFGGEERERRAADSELNQVVGVQKKLLLRQLALDLVTQAFSYMGSTVSYAIIAVPIFTGAYDDKTGAELSSLISLNAFVAMYLIYRFSVLIEQAKKLSDIAGYATRIVQLWEEIDRFDSQEEKQHSSNSSNSIVAKELDVRAPNNELLIKGLDLEIAAGQSLIITGANGVGKTSLLRTLCGLWSPSSGQVSLPFKSSNALDVFFLPQRPYVIAGSLREQLTYPGDEWDGVSRACHDEQIVRLLATVGLAHLPQKISAMVSQSAEQQQQQGTAYDRHLSILGWMELLSPGEQQKMSVARVLFGCPKFAVLDECTSALDPEAEATLYQAMAEAGITFVSVSHRSSLLPFHTKQLHLSSGSFVLSNI